MENLTIIFLLLQYINLLHDTNYYKGCYWRTVGKFTLFYGIKLKCAQV